MCSRRRRSSRRSLRAIGRAGIRARPLCPRSMTLQRGDERSSRHLATADLVARRFHAGRQTRAADIARHDCLRARLRRDRRTQGLQLHRHVDDEWPCLCRRVADDRDGHLARSADGHEHCRTCADHRHHQRAHVADRRIVTTLAAPLPSWQVYPALHLTTDPGWLIAMRYRAEGGNDAGVLLGGSFVIFVLWMAATSAGYLLGALISDPRAVGLDLVMPIFFAAMLIPLWQTAPRRWRRGLAGSSPALSRSRSSGCFMAGGSSSRERSRARSPRALRRMRHERRPRALRRLHRDRGDGGCDLSDARRRLSG